MAYTNQTTHYGLPLPTSGDKSTFLDTNESFGRVDAALYEAQTNASAATQDIGQAQTRISALETAMTGAQTSISELQGRQTIVENNLTDTMSDVDTAQTDITKLQTDVTELDTRTSISSIVIDGDNSKSSADMLQELVTQIISSHGTGIGITARLAIPDSATHRNGVVGHISITDANNWAIFADSIEPGPISSPSMRVNTCSIVKNNGTYSIAIFGSTALINGTVNAIVETDLNTIIPTPGTALGVSPIAISKVS